MKKIVIFFHRKKIVYSKLHEPAQFFKATEVDGKKYITIIQTNNPNAQGACPMYHIPVNQVLGFRVLHSPFQLLLMRLVGMKPSEQIRLRNFNK